MNKNQRASESKTQRGVGSKINNFYQGKISHKILNNGDTSNKIPVPLSDGRTVVFAKCQEDVERVKAFWENQIKFVGII